MNTIATKPWHREPMMWLVVGIPLAAVVAGIAMISIASRVSVDHVAEPFRPIGKAQTVELSRDLRASELGTSAVLSVGANGRDLFVTLERAEAAVLELKLVHPIEQRLDVEMKLVAVVPGRFVGTLPQPLAPARWDLELGDLGQTWRIVGQLEAGRDGARLSPALGGG
jgi:hypothetical protein